MCKRAFVVLYTLLPNIGMFCPPLSVFHSYGHKSKLLNKEMVN